MNDLESEPSWLEKLRELNAVIAETGEPLMGNLFYDHLQEDYVSSPPNAILREKRDRFRKAIAGRVRLLEVGVNGAHSAFLALTSDPRIEFHGVDICEHAYVKPATDWLAREFPERVFFHEGDCRMVLPRLRREGWRFDAFHIDGAKFTYFEDIRNCQMMISTDAIVIVDDSQLESVSRVLVRCQRQGRTEPLPGFPVDVDVDQVSERDLPAASRHPRGEPLVSISCRRGACSSGANPPSNCGRPCPQPSAVSLDGREHSPATPSE